MAAAAEEEDDGKPTKRSADLKAEMGASWDQGAFYQEAFQDPWADYEEPTATPTFLGDLEDYIIYFFRGNKNPAAPKWKTRVVWYSSGGGVNVPS